jgi:hypothetical protein
MGQTRNMYKLFVRKPEGKRPCTRLKCRWDDNIIIDHRERGWEGVDWINLAQDQDWWCTPVNMVINLWVPYKAGNLTDY